MGNQPGYENTELNSNGEDFNSALTPTETHNNTDDVHHNLNDSDFNEIDQQPDSHPKENSSFSPKLPFKKKIEFEYQTSSAANLNSGDEPQLVENDEVTDMDKKFRRSKIKTPKMRRSKTNTHQPKSSSKIDPNLLYTNQKPNSSYDTEELDASDGDDSGEGDNTQVPKKSRKFSFRPKKKVESTDNEEPAALSDNDAATPRKKIFSRIRSHREHTSEVKKETGDPDDDIKKYNNKGISSFSQKTPNQKIETNEPKKESTSPTNNEGTDDIKTFKKSKSLIHSPKSVKKSQSTKKSKQQVDVLDNTDQLQNDDYME